MSSAEAAELRRGIGDMRQYVRTLTLKYGDVAAVRRLMADLDRLAIDVDDFAEARLEPAQRQTPVAEKIAVPDTRHDPASWVGADDEGLGGYHGSR